MNTEYESSYSEYLSIFDEIIQNRQDGASTLTRKTLLKIKELIPDIENCNELKKVIQCAKSLRSSMPMIRNTVSKLEHFYEGQENFDRKELADHIDSIMLYLENKRKKIIEFGLSILTQHRNIGLVSFSSNIAEIVSRVSGKNFFALYGDDFAKMYRCELSFVRDELMEDKIDVGLMGADAVILSKNIYIVNGFPSERFAEAIKRKKIFVIAETEKIVSEDLEIQIEQSFDRFEMKENMYLVLV
ncbi:MAG: hypothetical protein NZ927_09405 [Candidatus Calescibacterium sp.]|nr:hypothetical protein [Candidatus Calescibacterium sp.]MCX7734985.1 hypothetical protein [bacterium]